MFSSNTTQISSAANYIEDVFSTYLYTGNGSTQTITNSIDLAGKGGLVWIKSRSSGANYYDHVFCDTVRGPTKYLASSGLLATAGEQTGSGPPNDITSFNNNGFSLGPDNTFYKNTGTSTTYASWTFRKQPKFFDVVTYTGDGTNNRQIAHSLASVPGMVIVKRTNTTSNWVVWHRSLPMSIPNDYNTAQAVYLNSTAANNYGQEFSIDGTVDMSSTTFVVSDAGGSVALNALGDTYVAYLFAHNAGGFGLTGTDNVISCGSVTSDGSGSASVNLGWEPQWILLKNATGAQYWYVVDNMRGLFAKYQNGNALFPNSTSGETAGLGTSPWITSTGMEWNGSYNPLAASSTYIYIAIRRGPMKVPTSGTSVFAPAAFSSAATRTVTAGFPVDLSFQALRTTSNYNNTTVTDRLRGSAQLITSKTDAESVSANTWLFDSNTSFIDNFGAAVYWLMRRAPSFFDVVCYTGTGSSQYLNHALGVDPELIICKKRSAATSSGVQMQLATKPFNGTYTFARGAMSLDSTAASTLSDTGFTNTTIFNPQYVTDTSATYGTQNASGATYVAYLFATCAGVSKVGSYTGTGATQTISCGFAGGARFVLIKRTDISGNWWAWDTARGMVAGTDPRKVLNATDADVNANWVYTATGGFQLVTSNAEVNASGGTYIFLAIA